MRRLCATFGTYTDPIKLTALATVVKYEKQAVTFPDVESTATLCKFALFVISSQPSPTHISCTPLTALKQPHSVTRHSPRWA